jgi:hypothetical protein
MVRWPGIGGREYFPGSTEARTYCKSDLHLLRMYNYIFLLASNDAYTFLSEMGFGYIAGTIGDTQIALIPLTSSEEAKKLFNEMKSRNFAFRWFVELR